MIAAPDALEKRPMPDGRIVGGFRIDISQIPYQASFQQNGAHKCGASIISDRWLLTAAHCVLYVKFEMSFKMSIVHVN